MARRPLMLRAYFAVRSAKLERGRRSQHCQPWRNPRRANYRTVVISVATYYIWKRKFGSLQESDVKRLRELEKENGRLKRILAEHVVAIDAMKELISKKL